MSSLSFFELEDRPFGKSFSEWTCKWWQSFDFQGWRRRLGPVFMLPGKRVNEKGQIQHTDTFFKIKHDKAILFTIINWIQPEEHEWQDFNKPTLISSLIRSSRVNLNQLAMQRMDVVNVPGFVFMIDDQDVRPFIRRVDSNGIFKIRGVECASDGFWLFLKPNTLSKGQHRIGSHGTCSSGKTQITNDYSIEII